jgi:acetylornithine/succinyldiaminopimelate/putrescine aminotransferase
MSTKERLETHGRMTSPALHAFRRSIGWDLLVARADGTYLHDVEGRTYLDAHTGAGIHNLGHRPAAVVAALRRAARETDQGNFPMISAEKAALGRDLAAFTGGDLPRVTYGVMRGEAVDFACKLARGVTGRPRLLAAAGCAFGQTGFALALSSLSHREVCGPLIPACERHALEDGALIRAVGPDTAAVLLEPIQAENHAAAPDPAAVQALAARCHEVGALLVIDETQTGFGRTGARFAWPGLGVSPDMVVLGEALGAGVFPIVATVCTDRLGAFLDAHPLIHLSTFGGADLGCVAARAALAAYVEQQPWVQAAHHGARLGSRLEALVRPGSPVRSASGRGLLWSLDLGTEERAQAFCRALAAERVLAATGQVRPETVVLRPALTMTDADLEHLAAACERAVRGED